MEAAVDSPRSHLMASVDINGDPIFPVRQAAAQHISLPSRLAREAREACMQPRLASRESYCKLLRLSSALILLCHGWTAIKIAAGV